MKRQRKKISELEKLSSIDDRGQTDRVTNLPYPHGNSTLTFDFVLQDHLFWGQKVKCQGYESQKAVTAYIHSCECWLLLVFKALKQVINAVCLTVTRCTLTFNLRRRTVMSSTQNNSSSNVSRFKRLSGPVCQTGRITPM